MRIAYYYAVKIKLCRLITQIVVIRFFFWAPKTLICSLLSFLFWLDRLPLTCYLHYIAKYMGFARARAIFLSLFFYLSDMAYSFAVVTTLTRHSQNVPKIVLNVYKASQVLYVKHKSPIFLSPLLVNLLHAAQFVPLESNRAHCCPWETRGGTF